MDELPIPKQRGIYSEILTTEDPDNLKHVSTIGPSETNLIESNRKQRLPRARGISKERKAPATSADVPQVVGKEYFRNPQVNTGFYSKKRQGVSDPDPKVMEPFIPIPGKPPRKVVIDRQRKLFASLNIEDLLLELGIDYRNPTENASEWLPLEPFDDLEYDCRLPHEWLELGLDADGAFAPIPAKGLFRYDDGSAEWRAVLIESWDDEREVYCGHWDGTSEYVELTRINLLFNSEDPRIFAQRVAQAHQERIYADSIIRYNFFIDNMPTDDIPEIDQEQSMRIFRMATNSRYLKSRGNLETATIMFEVNQDYARTMNKIIMDKTLEKSPEELQGMIPANLTLPDKPKPKEVPYYGQVPIPPHDFPDAMSHFNFSSIYIKEESIKAMVEIRTACNKLMDERIYSVDDGKVMLRVDEFKMIQTNSISMLASNCGENGWCGNLVKIIKTHFDDVGKGWFNIHEKSKATYEFGKLKKFLTLVNFMMQDTVLNICKDSVKEFVGFILDRCPTKTEIHKTNDVRNSFANKKYLEPGDSDYEDMPFEDVPEKDLDDVQETMRWLHKEFDKNKDPEALFVVDLIVQNETPIPKYTTQPDDIIEKILTVFDAGIEELGKISQLEQLLLRKLFKSQQKFVKAPQRPQSEPAPPDPEKKKIPDENGWLWWAYQDLKHALERNIAPLHEFLETFRQFEPEHNLNADKYMKNIEDPPEGSDPWDAEMLRQDILNNLETVEELKLRIPESVTVAVFHVILKDIRNNYCARYETIIEKEKKLIATIAIDKTYDINKKFEEINEQIQRPPTDIEDLYEIKKYMIDCGVTIEKLRKEIDGCMRCYDIATEFNHEFSNTENDNKWKLYGAPLRTMEIITAQILVLDKQKEAFLKEMEQEQVMFNDTLELLRDSVDGFSNNFNKLENYKEAAEAVESINARLAQCKEDAKRFNLRENLTQAPITDYSTVQAMDKSFQPYSNLWLTCRTWFEKEVVWKDGPLQDIDPEDLDTTFEQCIKTINVTTRFFKDKAGLEKILEVATTVKGKVDEFKPVVPIALSLRKQGMVERHWDQITKSVGQDIRPCEGFTLQSCIDKGILKHTELCEDVGERAYKEHNIEKSLKKMKADWEPLKFLLPQFKQTTTCTIAGFDDAVQLLDEHIVTSQAMKFSPFRGPFEEEINEWCDRMMLCQETLDEWVNCQRAWSYLQPIFESADIAAQLKAETKRFRSVDATWRSIINDAKEDKAILSNCTIDGLKDKFIEANKNLEIVHKGLTEYLEKKRSAFSRFFFLSDEELLEILSKTKEVKNVRPFLKQIFEAIADLVFDDQDRMGAMISAEKEQVNFVKKVDPAGKQVEYWMGDIEKMMCNSVRNVLWKSVEDYTERKRIEWVKLHPGQCVLNGSQVHWTYDVEKAITENGVQGLKDYLAFCQEQLLDSVDLVRTKLTKQAKITLNALITIDVHANTVVEMMINAGVSDISEFEWIQQLRYYWADDDAVADHTNEDGNCYVRCVQTDFPYGYEYLGNSMRLVITPLTDKCYMTLMGALSLNLGGAPAGPAGTGKTESTKDLAKALAKQCVVFNCSDSMDHLFVAKYFKGLASSGAWVCFDEFNRINVEVLSVIAQQLIVLFGAKAERVPEIVFEESLIKMKPTFCVFITMNPGYAGRSELPDNLVALFRPVAMMVPDYALIGEIMLYSFGFREGKILAEKMVTTFRLASEQLSSQDHYDYGMRAVRSVINAGGNLKGAFPDDNEHQLMLRALREVNVPKFLKDDIPLFENIIIDLFPGVERPKVDYGDLGSSITQSCAHFNVQEVELFNQKIMQLYDTILVRHGLMIVGPTGGGKTKIYKVLQRAISELRHQEQYNLVKVNCLNPKSITQDQLYGFSDPQTQEWQDGILAKIVLECSKDDSPTLRWVLFDGPVDAIWIENMNTVLDDNKKLCLNSGQVIPLTPRMNMIFEVADLAVASPATVSRCGMVYVEPSSLGLAPYFTSWLNTLPPKVAENPGMRVKLQELGDKLLEDGCYFVRHDVKEPVKTVDNNIIQSLFRIFDCYLADYIETEIKKVSAEKVDDLLAMTPQLFLYAFIWSIGTTTDLSGRQKFNNWIRKKMPELGTGPFPEDGLVYDYTFDIKTKTWVSWYSTQPEYSVNTQKSFNEILVPTLDSIRMKSLTKLLLTNGKHVLCPGPTGTGKSVNIGQLLTYDLDDTYMTTTFCFSAQTSANQTQDQLDNKFDKRRKGVFGPPVGKRFILFVDDINMPKKEEWGAMPPLELLRQYMDHSGWYDRKNKDRPFCTIEDLYIVSACGPPGGGRSDIPERLQRHFNILTYTDLQQEAINTIFSTILSAFWQTFQPEIKDSIQSIMDISLDIYDQVLNGPLKPTPNKSHYLFNLRDISRIVQGLVNADRRETIEPVQVVRMWIHESRRVYGDRLIDNKDRNWLDNTLLELSMAKFSLTKEEIMNSERLLYGDYMDGLDADPRIYKQIPDTKVLVEKVIEYLEEYNGAVKTQMKLVMFLDACDHVSRITRIIRQPLGNALLLGVGGSGRQSLSRLASYMATYKIFQIDVVKGYGMMNWREDAKKCLMMCGIDNKPTSFLFVDTQIVNEQMLEDINNILNAGDIPNLYKVEDLEPIYKVGKQACIETGLSVNTNNMFVSYVARVKKNVHMIIAMSPLGEIFRSRLRKFPSLVNCCTIDWFSEWPEEALLGVGRGQILAADLNLEKDLDACVQMFTIIHQSVEKESIAFLEALGRRNYVTPTSFLEQLVAYGKILKSKRTEVSNSKTRLVKGLDVLEKAQVEIDKLKLAIQEAAPKLAETKKEVAKTMEFLAVEKKDADAEREIVAKDEAIASAQEADAASLMATAQKELDKALPLLDAATKVLNSLDKGDFYTLKGIRLPTPAVVAGMECACIMLQEKPPKNVPEKDRFQNDDGNFFYQAQKKLLNDPASFLTKMKTFDKENIPQKVVTNVVKVFESGRFTLEAAQQASVCLVGIYKWCEAMTTYHELLKTVNPLRQQAAEKTKELEVIRKMLTEKRAKLKEVQEKIDGLERTYQEKVDFEAKLQAQIDDANLKLSRANKIIDGLASEKTRWEATVERLGNEYGYLIGNCLIAAGMVAYGGAFTAQYRGSLEAKWREEGTKRGIKMLDGISMKGLLEDPIKTKMWTASSLPNDNLSIENAIIMFGSRRWPMMIDPQNQANKFLKRFGADETNAPNGMETYKMSDPALMKMLELGVQFGRWFLVENVGEELDPALDPILQKQVDKSGNLRLGDKSIQYDANFFFLMTTTLPNPHYSPETQVKVTILNFAITPFGLEEQMLNQFVGQEMPDLQKKKDQIVQDNARGAKMLFECEDKILDGLTKNENIADILEDDELINVLADSRAVSDDIKVRMAEAEKAEVEIDKTREDFRPVAFRASLLFFTIIDLSAISEMYQYSLQWFAGLFGSSVDNSAKSKDSKQRIENLNNHFTLSLYENICRSLFERHKLMFSLILCAKILFGAKRLDPQEWRFFLAGPTGTIESVPNPTTWLGDLEWSDLWKQLYAMSQLETLKGFDKYFLENSHEFQRIFDSGTPQNEPMPGKWNDLDYFQKMIIIKAIRSDKVPFAIQNFVKEKIGEQYIIPPTFNLAKSYKDSSATTPLIFVLSQGSDPVADFKRYADEMNMSKKFMTISLGRGQDKKAINCINDNASRGGWALLMNCHLASGFMPKLETIVDTLDQTQPHRDFRLWLTSMPAKTFPVSVLQNSVKMTLEPPSGLRQNVRSSYEALNWQEIEETEKPESIKKILFGFCFFHAIVQDRRKFGPIGWNIPYAFTNEDLMVCRKQTLLFIDRFDQVPYKVLNYLGANVNYGGRVTDDKDVLLIETILRTYICSESLTVGHKYSTSGLYKVIEPGEKEDYLKYIDTMPLNPEPEAFGLHDNAEITTKQNQTIDLLLDVLSMQPKSSGGGGATREEIIGKMAKDLEKRTPPVFDTEHVMKNFPTMYNESMNTVLFQECVRYNNLLADMAVMLKQVQRALIGEVVMSEDLEAMSDAIFDNRVPPSWTKKGFLSMKPLSSWIEDCNQRIDFLNKWISGGTPNVFWVSGFFFPQAFFTGSLQNYARAKTIAVDKISFDFVFKDSLQHEDIKEAPEVGVYCYGMYLEGCKWNYDTHMLDDSDPKKLFVDLPMLWFKPEAERKKPESGVYLMPIYKVLSRRGTLSTTGHSTNFVMKVEIPTDRNPDFWVKAGVAGFLALRY